MTNSINKHLSENANKLNLSMNIKEWAYATLIITLFHVTKIYETFIIIWCLSETEIPNFLNPIHISLITKKTYANFC